MDTFDSQLTRTRTARPSAVGNSRVSTKTPPPPPPEPKKTMEWVPATMDPANKKAAELLAVSTEAFMKHVSTDQSTGRKLSYAEMRMMYG